MKKLLSKLRFSLAARLLLISMASMAAVFVILIIFFGAGWNHKYEQVLAPHLQQYRQFIVEDIGSPASRDRAAALAKKLPIEIYIFDEQGSWSSDGYVLNTHTLESIHHHPGKANVLYDSDSHRQFIRNQIDGGEIFFSFTNSSPDRLIVVLLLLIGGILTASYFLIRRLFRPLQAIRSGVEHFSHGNFKHRITTHCCDELGQFGNQINHMADEIDAMLSAKRDLLLAISHELRSPLTRSKVALALLDEDEISASIGRDLNEMDQLIAEILESERLRGDNSHSVLNTSLCHVTPVIQDVIKKLDPKQQQLIYQAPEDPLTWCFDKPRIKLLLQNVFSNALRHNRPHRGPVNIVVAQQQALLQITISDHGEGIAAEHIPHLTEPFYRADPSRQRKTGGYGLGLHLCRAIAESHGGQLSITSEQGVGTVVELTLPRQPNPQTG